MRTGLKLLAIIAALLAVYLAIAHEKSKMETPITVTQSNMALPQGGFLKIGELREEAGTVYRWTGSAWIVNGTGTADISRWPTVGIKEEEVREDEITGKRFVFRGGQWLEIVQQTGGSLPEEVKDEMENYFEVELGVDYPVAGRPLFLHPDGKAYLLPATGIGPASSLRVGVSNQTGTVGQNVKAYPVGIVKGLTGIVPKRRYEVSFSSVQTVTNAIQSISGGRSAMLGSELYTIGMSGSASNRTNVVTGVVTPLTNLVGLYNHAVAACNGYVYVIGGMQNGMLHYVTKIDQNGDAVTPVPSIYSIPLAMEHNTRPRVTVVGNLIYVICKDEMNGLCNIMHLDTVSETWTIDVFGTTYDLYNSVPMYEDEGGVPKILFFGGYDEMTFQGTTRQVEWTIGNTETVKMAQTLPFGMTDGYAHKVGTEYVIVPTSATLFKTLEFDPVSKLVTEWGTAGTRNLSGIGVGLYDGFFYGYGFNDPMTMQQSIVAKILQSGSATFTHDTFSMGVTPYMYGTSTTSAYVLPISY